MLNTIDDIKNYINKHEYYDTLESFIYEEFYDELKNENITYEYKENLGNYEHRWYIVGTNVYEFFKNGKSLGFLAINEVGTLKSEMMSRKDCYEKLIACNVKEIIKKSFEIVKDNKEE